MLQTNFQLHNVVKTVESFAQKMERTYNCSRPHSEEKPAKSHVKVASFSSLNPLVQD